MKATQQPSKGDHDLLGIGNLPLGELFAVNFALECTHRYYLRNITEDTLQNSKLTSSSLDSIMICHAPFPDFRDFMIWKRICAKAIIQSQIAEERLKETMEEFD